MKISLQIARWPLSLTLSIVLLLRGVGGLSSSFGQELEEPRSIAQINDFVFPWSSKSAPKTVFTSKSSKDLFEFSFDVEDDDIIFREEWAGESSLDEEDRVEIFFTNDPNLGKYYCIEIDSRGRVHDYRAEFYRKFDQEWDCEGLKITSNHSESGYRIEGSIPIATLRGLLKWENESSQPVYLGLFRAEFYSGPKENQGDRPDNWLSWIRPKTDKPDFHVPDALTRCNMLSR